VKDDPQSIARKSYQAYIDKDRAAIETVLSEDFHFTSPLDNRLNRETYFDRCWKNSETIAGFKFVNLVSERARINHLRRATHDGQAVPQYGNNDRPRWQNCRGRSLFRLVNPARGPRGRFR
jgi:hypothetical protein